MSPNKILPSSPYTLSYFLTDHTDSATYYVRAVVYDATTGEVLDSQNLTRQSTNTRLFSKRAQAPGDSSGQGRKIIVVATAYEDSGYTIKSSLYQEQSEVYVVQKELTYGGGNGGSYGTDYGKIKEIVQTLLEARDKAEAVKKASKPKEKPVEMKLPEMPFDAIFGALGALQREINRIPKELLALTPVLGKLDDVLNAIKEKEVTPATDLSEVMTELKSIDQDIEALHEAGKESVAGEITSLKDELPKMIEDNAKKAIDGAKLTLDLPKEVTATAKSAPSTGGKPMEVPVIDIRNLIGRTS